MDVLLDTLIVHRRKSDPGYNIQLDVSKVVVDDIGYFVGTVITTENGNRSIRTINCAKMEPPFNTKEYILTILKVDAIQHLHDVIIFRHLSLRGTSVHDVRDDLVVIPPSKVIPPSYSPEYSDIECLLTTINTFVVSHGNDEPLLMESLENLLQQVQIVENLNDVAEDVLWSMSELFNNQTISEDAKELAHKIIGVVEYLHRN